MEVNDSNIKPVDRLEGMDLLQGWHVVSKHERHPRGTGGCFSVSYLVKNKEGTEAFLKAFDLMSAFRADNFTLEVEALFKAFNFECDLLEKCKTCSRVVTSISHGVAEVSGVGHLNRVPYLIFERAKHNIREETYSWKEFDIAWALRKMIFEKKKDKHQEMRLINPYRYFDF